LVWFILAVYECVSEWVNVWQNLKRFGGHWAQYKCSPFTIWFIQKWTILSADSLLLFH